MRKGLVIAAELRSLRAKRGVSQSDVAKAVGTTQTTVSAWENRAGVSLEDAWKLADFYGVTLDELAGRKVS